MFKNFLIKKALQSQMKNIPKDMQDKIMGIMEKNPELLMNLAKEVQEEMKNGTDQMAAFQKVAEKHKDQLKGLLQ